jgi:hypothetical protein
VLEAEFVCVHADEAPDGEHLRQYECRTARSVNSSLRTRIQTTLKESICTHDELNQHHVESPTHRLRRYAEPLLHDPEKAWDPVITAQTRARFENVLDPEALRDDADNEQ